MNDVIDGCRIEGEVLFNGKNIYANSADIRLNRKKIGIEKNNGNKKMIKITTERLDGKS